MLSWPAKGEALEAHRLLVELQKESSKDQNQNWNCDTHRREFLKSFVKGIPAYKPGHEPLLGSFFFLSLNNYIIF